MGPGDAHQRRDAHDEPFAAADAARSVFDYVERTAETMPDGVRWETLSYENRRYYDASPFNGTGGIPLFLADYYAATGSDRALDLARGAARWCAAPGRTFVGEAYDDRGAPASLCFGLGGVALAWVRLAAVTGDWSFLDDARAIGDRIAAARIGPVTDYLGGAAGEGIALTRPLPGPHVAHGPSPGDSRRRAARVPSSSALAPQRPYIVRERQPASRIMSPSGSPLATTVNR